MNSENKDTFEDTIIESPSAEAPDAPEADTSTADAAPSLSDEKMRRRTVKKRNKGEYGERIRAYRLESGLSTGELAAQLGITQNAIVNWEIGVSRPDFSYVAKLCKALSISADTLFNVELDFAPLSKTEQDMMTRYRSLDKYKQHAVNSVIDSLIELDTQSFRDNCLESYSRIVRTDLPASAGTGMFLTDGADAADQQRVFLKNSKEVRHTDAVITVSGNSMFPTFCDGDELMVEYTSQIKEGEIGIFVVNGEGYVKEYRQDGLHSHNPQYKTIRPTQGDDFRCIGRVLGKVTEDMYPKARELDVLTEIYEQRDKEEAEAKRKERQKLFMRDYRRKKKEQEEQENAKSGSDE